MNICLVSPVFSPEPIVSARTTADIAAELSRQGHHVQVITSFPNRPAGKLYDGYRRKLFQKEKSSEGFRILRCFSFFSNKSSMISRFLENLSFGLASAAAVFLLPKPEVLYANTWPIFAQGFICFVCKVRGIPLVLSVQDVYPETLLAQGRVKKRESWLSVVLRWFDKKNASSANLLVVISNTFKKLYVETRGIPAEKIRVIPNWVDEKAVEVQPVSNPIRKIHDIPANAFLVVYAGNIGVAAGVESVIEAFSFLSEQENIYMLVSGSGSQLESCRALAKVQGNPRVIFHTPWLPAETSTVLAAADLFILPTVGDQSEYSLPSKLIMYMLASRPILAFVKPGSEVEVILSAANAGWTVAQGATSALASEIRRLSRLRSDDLNYRGVCARNYALTHMTLQSVLPTLTCLILETGIGSISSRISEK